MRNKHFVLFILSVLSIITFLDRNAISLAGHRITTELGLSESQFGWILSAFTISYGLFEIPTGLMGDRLGARRVLARVVVWWSLFTVFTGFARGFLSLFAIRFLFGAGEAGAYPNTAIAIRKWYSVPERGRAQAVIWMASRLGGALAPFLVIPIQMQFGWRSSFYVLGVVGIIWAAVWLVTYKDMDSETHSAGTGAHNQIPWKFWLTNLNFWLLMAMYFCYASGVFFFISWLPKYLQLGKGISEKDLSWSASLPFLLGALGCLAGGAMSDYLVKKLGIHWGRRIVPMFGLSLSGVSMLLATQATNNNVVVILVALGLAFMDVTAPVSWAVATEMGGKLSGTVTGAMNTAGLLGGTVCSVGIGYLITLYGSYDLPVAIIGLLLVLGALLWFVIDPAKSMDPDNEGIAPAVKRPSVDIV
ncbi:MAG: MFS transporter [Bacteroidetes bacterium]|nr:MFS transporter [Bacteroidota bacterium]